jgi:hypothetical protein
MKYAVLLVACALPLAGCGKPDVEAKNASAAEVAEKVRAAGADVRMKPGKWAMTAVVEKVEMPGMPPEMAAAFSNTSGQETKFESCLTQAEADRPAGKFFGGDKNGDCTYERFTMSGGKIDARANCKIGAMQQTIAMNGQFGEEQFSLRQSVETDGPPGSTGKMKATVRIDSRRVGECDAKSAQG